MLLVNWGNTYFDVVYTSNTIELESMDWRKALNILFIVSIVILIFQMCVRQYPIVAKFGMMHLIAANICIYILSTFIEVKNSITHKSGRMMRLQGSASNQTYYLRSDTGELPYSFV